MSTDTDKYDVDGEREPRHSALAELARDERRPAVILLSALLLAAIFFAFGIMVGRWTVQPKPQTPATSNSSALTPPPSNAAPSPPPLASATTETQARPVDTQRRFSLLIENPASREAAQSLVKSLERAGYKDVRMGKRQPVPDAPFPVLIGHYTRDEAEAEAARLRTTGGHRLKNVLVIEDTDGENP
jgi:hypothetical protein